MTRIVEGVGPRTEKFNIVSNDHGQTQNALPVFSVRFGNSVQENILQTITHLIQYTVLGIQFWSVKYTAVTVGYAKLSSNGPC